MRDNSVTIAKGIAIILMVFGHSGSPEFANQFLSLLRMPLFFFMSGYCFKDKYLLDAKAFIKKRIKGVWFPYVKWSFFFLLVHNWLYSFGLYDKDVESMLSIRESIVLLLKNIFLMTRCDTMIGGFWFLNALFFGSIIFYFVKRYIKNFFFGLFITFFFCFFCAYFQDVVGYLHIISMQFLAAFLIMIGNQYKNKKCTIHLNHIFIAICFITVAFGAKYWSTNMQQYTIYNVVPYTITAILGTLIIFYISSNIQYYNNCIIRFLVFTGNNTFTVLTWHFSCLKIVSFFIISIYNLPFDKIGDFPIIQTMATQGWWFIYCIFGVGIPLLIKKIYIALSNRNKVTL